jgi:antitoxin MazE
MNKGTKPIILNSAPLQVAIRAIGNSKGVVIPKIILEQSGIQEMVEMSVDGEKIILSKPKNAIRERWAQDAESLVKAGEDKLVLGDFANQEDGDWVW